MKPTMLLRIAGGLFVAALATMLAYYYLGADSSIDWKLTTQAEAHTFDAYSFQKGLFEFSIPGAYYTLTESFSAGPITRNMQREAILLGLVWLGLISFLSFATYLKDLWFYGISGLFIFLLIHLKLTSIGLSGLNEGLAHGIILLLFLAPAYLFHTYLNRTPAWLRILTLVGSSVILYSLLGTRADILIDQVTVGLYFGLVVLALLFIFFVAEENIFGILYLVTKNKGGSGNQTHFAIFSGIYLVFMILVYCKKASIIRLELPFFDPYVLLSISALVTIWSLYHKKPLYVQVASPSMVNLLYFAAGISVFGFLGLAFSQGNDPLYEGLHYFIIYAHLGFGAFFFFYIIANFITPLTQGLQVYKIAYLEQNLPYVSAKIGGLVAIAAFFFLSQKEPFLLFRAGHFNYLGAQVESQNETNLAQQYYLEGRIYGYDNHYSNYKVAYHQLAKNKIEDANHKFGRATFRYPSPQSYVNYSATYGKLNEISQSIVSLQDGLRRFPGNNQMLNNLGLIYMDMGNLSKAKSTFSQANEKGGWNHANEVNLWSVGLGENAVSSYAHGLLPVKANVLATLLHEGTSQAIDFDPKATNHTYGLHRKAFLINSAWYFRSPAVNKILKQSLSSPTDASMSENGLHALALSEYVCGNVSNAIKRLDNLWHQQRKHDYLNQMGLLSLDQHNLPLALDFFKKAKEAGNTEAAFNEVVTLLELGAFKNALKSLDNLTANDTSLLHLKTALTQVLSASPNEPSWSGKLYYQYADYSPEQIKDVLNHEDKAYAENLWVKLSQELMLHEQFDKLEEYFPLFERSLSHKVKEKHLRIMALRTGDTRQLNPKNAPDTLVNKALLIEASSNLLDVPLTLAMAHYLRDKDRQDAYDLLVQAIDLNPHNLKLLQTYALTAMDLHLADYAEDVLDKINNLSTPAERQAFYSQYLTKKATLDSLKALW